MVWRLSHGAMDWDLLFGVRLWLGGDRRSVSGGDVCLVLFLFGWRRFRCLGVRVFSD